MNIIGVYERIKKRLAKAVKTYYRNRLVSLVFFGSSARKTVHPFSDVDFLIVAHPLPRGRIARVKEFRKIEEALRSLLAFKWKNIKDFIPLSPLLKTPEEVRMGSLLFLDFVTDAEIMYDRNNFFKNFLRDFKGRLHELGAKKIPYGGAWYWVLKPDYKPGDTINLSV